MWFSCNKCARGAGGGVVKSHAKCIRQIDAKSKRIVEKKKIKTYSTRRHRSPARRNIKHSTKLGSTRALLYQKCAVRCGVGGSADVCGCCAISPCTHM